MRLPRYHNIVVTNATVQPVSSQNNIEQMSNTVERGRHNGSLENTNKCSVMHQNNNETTTEQQKQNNTGCTNASLVN